jgi:hypothetical protein
MEHARCAKLKLGVEGEAMDMNFLRAHAERCRSLAESADEFTKQRLLDLAAKYDKRLTAARPSAATRFLKAPIDLVDAPKRNVAER